MFEFFITNFLLLFWPSLASHRGKSFLAVHRSTERKPVRGYAENAGRSKSGFTRRAGTSQITRKCCPSKACPCQRPIRPGNHDLEQAEIATRTICHFVRSLRGLSPRISASARGTAVANLCKLFKELV